MCISRGLIISPQRKISLATKITKDYLARHPVMRPTKIRTNREFGVNTTVDTKNVRTNKFTSKYRENAKREKKI